MESITFDEVEKIINEQAEEFNQESVIGIGVSEREEKLRFVIMVEDEKAFDDFSKKYKGKEVNGFPIYVEIGSILTIDRSVDMSMDIDGDPWPFWMRHRHDFLPIRILLSPFIVFSWFFWRCK